VAIVDQAFVDRFLPGIDPVGRRIHPTNTPSWLEIVGVVRNVRQGPLRFPSEPTIYRSFRQNRVIMAAMSFLLKTGDRPAAHAEAAAGVVREVDPDLPTYSVFPMDRVVANARRQERLLMVLFGIFSGLTGILAALGVYGVVGSAVTRRSREIGIRLALGGAKPGILRMLLGEGMRTGILGILFGLVLALGLSRLLSSFLFEVQPGDAGIATGSVALAVLIVTLSSLFPALDATRIDPAQSVKAD